MDPDRKGKLFARSVKRSGRPRESSGVRAVGAGKSYVQTDADTMARQSVRALAGVSEVPFKIVGVRICLHANLSARVQRCSTVAMPCERSSDLGCPVLIVLIHHGCPVVRMSGFRKSAKRVRAVAECFGDMRLCELLVAREVGDGTCDALHALSRSLGQTKAFTRVLEQPT